MRYQRIQCSSDPLVISISEKAKAIQALSEQLNEELAKADALNELTIKIQNEYIAKLTKISEEQKEIIEKTEALEETIKKLISER